MISFASWPHWRHYWLELPRQALTGHARLPDFITTRDICAWQEGVTYLRGRLGHRFCALPSAEIIRRAQLARRWREVAPFRVLFGDLPPARMRMPENFSLPGPRLVLAAHLGSFFFACLHFARHGIGIDWLARAPDDSACTPLPERLYLRFNYWAMSRHLGDGRFIYTDFRRPPRALLQAFATGRTLGVLLDLPATLVCADRLPVRFLGETSWLPVALVAKAAKRGVRLYTAFYGYSTYYGAAAASGFPPLEIAIESIDAKEPEAILQTYADRLTEVICREPWLWMGLPIAASFHQPPKGKACISI